MDYSVIKSFRKSMALQVKNGMLVVRVPYFVSKKMIDEFILKHKRWIEKRINVSDKIIDDSRIQEYKTNAKVYIPERVKYFADKYNLHYNKIKITSAKTRWGSCTSKKNLNFSYRLILCPRDVIDYVIVHELSHLKEMNHSKRFRQEVSIMMPDYKDHNKWLKDNAHIF